MVNTSRSRLEEVNIGGLQPGKKYSVRVLAHNEHGPGTSSDVVDVETPAEPHVLQAPGDLSAVAVSPVSVSVSWQAPELVGGLPIRHFKLLYTQVGTSEEHEIATTHTSHTVHGLRPATEYAVWVVAFNENGPGTASDEMSVATWSDVPSDTPQNVSAEPASSTVNYNVQLQLQLLILCYCYCFLFICKSCSSIIYNNTY